MAVAYVQSASNTGHNASSAAKAFTSNNTAGNMLIAAVGVWKSGTFSTPTISDSNGNTWQLLLSTPRLFAFGQSEACLFVAYNCAAGANTVTVTVGVSSDIDFAIHEYSGCATVTARDQIAGATQNPVNTSILAGTVQTQHANEVLFSFAYDQTRSSQTFTPSAGWTGREQTANAGSESLRSFDEVVSSTGTFTNTISISTSSLGMHAIIASFADTSTSDTLVQSGKAAGAATSLGVSFPAANASGNLLLLAIGGLVSGTLGTITSVTDSQGNTWVLIGSTPLLSAHGQSQCHLYACASCAAGANTVTVATSSSQELQLIALEYSSGAINAQISNSAPNSASVASGNINADAGLAFTLAYNQTRQAGNYSDFSGTGWRQRVNQGDSGGGTLSTFDQILGGSSTIEQTLTVAVTSGGLHVLVAAGVSPVKPIMEFLIC